MSTWTVAALLTCGTMPSVSPETRSVTIQNASGATRGFQSGSGRRGTKPLHHGITQFVVDDRHDETANSIAFIVANGRSPCAIHARTRGVSVEVLLNQVRSSGVRPNDGTMEALRDGGIAAFWASSRFLVTHEKSMVIDDDRVLISTFNFSDRYFARTRDYGLVIEDGDIVAEVVAAFDADKASRVFDVPERTPLAWGNRTARTTVAAFIDAAEKVLLIQHPKFRDAAILERVLMARERGVSVKYICGGTHGIEDRDLIATLSYQRILGRAGVHLKRQRHLKLHTKLMLADGKRLMLGSMNIDHDGFDIRRELGIVLDDPKTVKDMEERFSDDWHEARAWEPCDPLRLDLKTAVDAEQDPVPDIRHD